MAVKLEFQCFAPFSCLRIYFFSNPSEGRINSFSTKFIVPFTTLVTLRGEKQEHVNILKNSVPYLWVGFNHMIHLALEGQL